MHFLVYLIVTCFLSVLFSTANQCSTSTLHQYYKELGCTPFYESHDPCPRWFDCSSYENRDPRKCLFNGRLYNVGEKVCNMPGSACLANCRCDRVDDLKSALTCAQVECPREMRGVHGDENCYPVYEKNKCCSEKTSCDLPPSVFGVSCTYGDTTYGEGQRFAPEGTCKTCICMEGFQGELEEPYCSDINCQTTQGLSSLAHERCAPVYYDERGCCPIDWKCPTAYDRVLDSGHEVSCDSPTCKFGNLTLQLGDTLPPDNNNVICACETPPYLTCLSKYARPPPILIQNNKYYTI